MNKCLLLMPRPVDHDVILRRCRRCKVRFVVCVFFASVTIFAETLLLCPALLIHSILLCSTLLYLYLYLYRLTHSLTLFLDCSKLLPLLLLTSAHGANMTEKVVSVQYCTLLIKSIVTTYNTVQYAERLASRS